MTIQTYPERPPSLADLVRARLDEFAISVREAARRSEGQLSYETLHRIMRGVHLGGITDRVAQGIALALELDLADVYAAAKATQPGRPWDWPSRFDRLTPTHRGIVESVAAGFLSAYGQDRTP